MVAVVRGTCGGVAAAILVDPDCNHSSVSTSFALSHSLPRSVETVTAEVSLTTHGPIIIPTPTGWFTSTVPIRIGYLPMYDIILGADWIDTSSVSLMGNVVLDPVTDAVLADGVAWTRSPQVFSHKHQSISADDLSCSSSSLSKGSKDVCATVSEFVRLMFSAMSSDVSGQADYVNGLILHGLSSWNGQHVTSRKDLILHVISGRCWGGCGRLCSAYTSDITDEQYRALLMRCVRDAIQNSSPEAVDAVAQEIGLTRGSLVDEIEALISQTLPISQVSEPVSSGSTAVLNEIEAMSLADIRCVAEQHGIKFGANYTREVLRVLISAHIANGSCARTSVDGSAPGCIAVTKATETVSPATSSDEARINILTHLLPKLSARALRRVLAANHVDYDSQGGVASLRRCLRTFIKTLRKGKLLSDKRRERHEEKAQQTVETERRRTARKREWPPKISPDLKEKLLRAFRRETGSAALTQFTCACCAGRCLEKKRRTSKLTELPLMLLRCPEDVLDSCPALKTPDLSKFGIETGVLLHEEGLAIDEGGTPYASLCPECAVALQKNTVPPLSLANKTYRGPTPKELSDLTFIEEQVIARCRAKVCIVHLQTDGEDNDAPVQASTQRGIRGHIIVHPQRPEQLAKILPPSIDELITPICVIFVGSKTPTKEWLEKKAKPLVVRRERIRAALHWLKENNPLYASVTIDENRIAELPIEGILPYETEQLPSDSSVEALTARYDDPTTESHPEDPGDISSRDIERREVDFQKVVITDVDGRAPSSQLRAAAIRHIKVKGGGYVELPHDSEPVNEFCNPTLFPMIYPTLFPYGVGGFEDGSRVAALSLRRQVRHLLNSAYKDFQTHHTFLFTAFNILQRRAVLLSTGLKVRKAEFQSFADRFASVSEESVARVCARVAENGFAEAENDEDRKVLQLMKEVQVVTRNVPGSSASRVAMRNEIRGLMATHGMPSFFITLNPADLYNPVVQVLGGADIDIDALLPEEVANPGKQSIMIARNPFLGAKFFNVYMKAFVREILGYDPKKKSDEGGVLGNVKAYYGCVEAQGRGTLHCHMMVWVEGGLSPTELQNRLKGDDSQDFGRRLIDFLDDVIANDVPDTGPESMPDPIASTYPTCHPDSHRGFPLNLDKETVAAFRKQDIRELVIANQTHRHGATCYKYCGDGPKKCRFDLDEENLIPVSSVDSETGELLLRIANGMINNYNPTILEGLRCNMDIQFIGSGGDAKAVIYYITDYITKSPLKAHISYAAMELAIRRLASMEEDGSQTDSRERCKRLLQRTAFALISNQELSAPQVASYLMDYEDHFSSHRYANLYWTSFERHVDQVLPLQRISTNDDEPDSADSADDNGEQEHVQDVDGFETTDGLYGHDSVDLEEVAITATADGSLVQLSSQLMDYLYRGDGLHTTSLWDYVASVRKDSIRGGDVTAHVSALNDNEDETGEVRDARRKTCVRFQPAHSEYERKIATVLATDAYFVPVLIGPSVPRRDRETDKERYSRLMLILFQPWRKPGDLKDMNETWSEAFDCCRENFPVPSLVVMDNLQLLHECRDSRDDHVKRGTRRKRCPAFARATEGSHAEYDLALMGDTDEEQLLAHLQSVSSAKSQQKAKETERVNLCILAAQRFGLFLTKTIDIDLSKRRTHNVADSAQEPVPLEGKWRSEYETRRKEWKKLLTTKDASVSAKIPAPSAESTSITVRDTSSLHNQVNNATCVEMGVRDAIFAPIERNVDIEEHIQRWKLNTEQARAFRIVAEHSLQAKPDPLRMFLGGVGGTGKSRVIQALTDFFACRKQARRLRLAAFTGVAARNIGGTTLHAALGLDQRKNGKVNNKTKRDLEALWNGVDYLLIDEVSMVGCKLLARISEALTDAKSDLSPFGGMNVILAGDFAQLPPVSETRLYAWIRTTRNAAVTKGQEVVMGKLLWLSFQTVVILREVMRQRGDSSFVQLLGRLREGKCTDADYKTLCTRVLGQNKNPPATAHEQGTPVIVYDNATKDAMNVSAAEAFASATGQQLHWYHAQDVHSGQPITDRDLLTNLHNMHSGQTSHRLGRIPLVLGMPVIICQNYDVGGGIVNGSIGSLEEIRYSEHASTQNRYLKSCVVRLQDVTALKMSELEDGCFPVLEDTVSMTFSHPHTGMRCTIKRTQVPIQPAFAITAHKAQGQTFESVVVDLAGCTGTESPYVMLSRATSLAGVTILRPFDKSKICCRQSEDLRKENNRLECLALRTIMEYGTEDERQKADSVLQQNTALRHVDEEGRPSSCTVSSIPSHPEDQQMTLSRIQDRLNFQFQLSARNKRPVDEVVQSSRLRPNKRQRS